MRKFMEAQELNFSAKLMKLLGIEKEQVEEIVERLDVDQISQLIDACNKDDLDAIKKLIGSTDESKEETKKEEDAAQKIQSILMPKDQAKKLKSKKHKLLKKELGEDDDTAVVFSIGDEVLVDGEEATVKIPSAPGGTVGVMINGEIKMVDKKTNNITKVDEAVLGMTAMPGLSRIQELAGMRPAMPATPAPPPLDFNEPAPGEDLPAHEPMDADFEEVSGPDLGGSAEVGGMGGLGADMGDDHLDLGMDTGADMGTDLGMGDAPSAPIALPAPDAPADMGMGGGMPQIGSALEDAAALDQAISDIENMIPNVKISEYKTLVQRLEGLIAMAKAAGKAALTESAKAKAKKSSWKKPWEDSKDADEHLMGDEEDELSDTKQYRKDRSDEAVAEGKLKSKEPKEDALDTDGDEKAEKEEDPKGRKTLMDYVKEADEATMALGRTPMDAAKALQARMGPKATPQQARQAFDKMKAKGITKNVDGSWTMPPMADDELNTELENTFAPGAGKPAPTANTPPQPAGAKTPQTGGQNGFQGQ